MRHQCLVITRQTFSFSRGIETFRQNFEYLTRCLQLSVQMCETDCNRGTLLPSCLLHSCCYCCYNYCCYYSRCRCCCWIWRLLSWCTVLQNGVCPVFSAINVDMPRPGFVGIGSLSPHHTMEIAFWNPSLPEKEAYYKPYHPSKKTTCHCPTKVRRTIQVTAKPGRSPLCGLPAVYYADFVLSTSEMAGFLFSEGGGFMSLSFS